MSTWDDRANDLFLEALKRLAPDDRRKFLDRECGGDATLQAEVEALLEASDHAGSFLESPAIAWGETIELVSPAEQPGTAIGPYKLLQQIGEGGMGTVYMAEQTEPIKRKVALKVIKPGMDSRQVVSRFEAERQALAMMDHVNIARVFDGGTTENGRPYFVMELVHGIPITKYCDDNHLTPRQRLELFVPVCQAIQHAHQKGIIHRDIKPSNVMVTLYDGKPVPKVIDFGVAKATEQKLTDRTLFTQYGTMVGTPLYMSPEQAEMSGLGVDTRTDVYALGVLLYELLTGTTPLDREQLKTAGNDEIRRIIREEEPIRPSTRISTLGNVAATVSANRNSDPDALRRQVRGELDWIAMKCLEKDRNRRYDTANSLAMDVQCYLNDETVEACPPSRMYRFRKFARRNRKAVATAAVAAVVLVIGVAVLATSTFFIARARDDLRRDNYFHRITLAYTELVLSDNLGRALKHLEACPQELRGWEWHYLKRLCWHEPVIIQDKTEVIGVSYSPGEGEWLASGGGDNLIKVRDRKTNEVIWTINAHTEPISSVVFHPKDKNLLASTGRDVKVRVWLKEGQKAQCVFDRDGGDNHDYGTSYTVAFSPNGRFLAVGYKGAVNVWEWEKGENGILRFPPLTGHTEKGISVAFSPDGRFLASGSWDGEIRIWDAETGNLLHRLLEHHQPVSAVAFSPDSQRLVSASFDRSLIMWDATNGQRLYTKECDGLVIGVAFSPDGLRLASVDHKTVRVWESATGREVLTLRGHDQRSQCVTFSPDGGRIASASLDKTIRIWDATPLKEDETQEAITDKNTSEVWTMNVSPDGKQVASAGPGLDTLVKICDVQPLQEGFTNRNQKPLQESFAYRGHRMIVFSVAWHSDGVRIASAGMDDQRKLFVVKVWNARNGQLDFELPPGKETEVVGKETFALAFSPDGNYLITGGVNGIVQVWDMRTKEQVGLLDTRDRKIKILGVTFSRDGKHLATVDDKGKVKVWDATRLGKAKVQTPLREFTVGVHDTAMTVAFSPNGQRLVAGNAKNKVTIWNVQTKEVLQSFDGHTRDVCAVAFSPDADGRWVASAGEDSTVKVWDTWSGKLVHNFRGHRGLVSSVAFSLDGKRLFSGSRDKTVKVWDLTSLIAEAADR